jgi:hypothetical protein
MKKYTLDVLPILGQPVHIGVTDEVLTSLLCHIQESALQSYPAGSSRHTGKLRNCSHRNWEL